MEWMAGLPDVMEEAEEAAENREKENVRLKTQTMHAGNDYARHETAR